MAAIKKQVLIEFSAERMFELVDRVEDYPQFLPWCGGTELLERCSDKTVARIHINYHGIKAHFATENDKQFPSSMTIRLREGPFSDLNGAWNFTPLGENACKVEFVLNYTFSSQLLEKVLGKVFHHIIDTFVDSFVKRAAQLEQ